MSDLFKGHKPELSEEEDRLLWQRVRAIPALETPPALRPAPWWHRLWAMPAVRYGAPALAMMVAAVIWVIEREPAYKTEAPRGRQEAPFVVQTSPPAPAPPVPTRNSVRVTAVDERAAAKLDAGSEAAKDKAEWRADAVAPSEDVTARSAAPTTTALRKSAPAAAPTFAPPPTEVETRERKQAAAPAPQAASVKAVDSKEASRAADKPQWGAVKNGYRDSGTTAQLERVQVVSVPDQLVRGTLPAPAQLADHPLLTAVSIVPYATAIWVLLPMDMRDEDNSQRARVVSRDVMGFLDVDVSVQTAAIALALERALAEPTSVPRTRVEAMLAHARAVDGSANAAEKPGTSRLVAMIEGALKAWP